MHHKFDCLCFGQSFFFSSLCLRNVVGLFRCLRSEEDEKWVDLAHWFFCILVDLMSKLTWIGELRFRYVHENKGAGEKWKRKAVKIE